MFLIIFFTSEDEGNNYNTIVEFLVKVKDFFLV